MISKKWTFFYLLMLAVCGYIYYDSQQNETNKERNWQATPNGPTYKSQSMSSRVYDVTGKINYFLVADNVEHFSQRGETQFTAPIMTLYDPQKQPNWRIESKHATLTQDKMLSLYGRVDVDSLTRDAQLKKIIGSNVVINLVTRDITSEDEVTLTGASFTSVGRRLEGNLASKTAKLFENVNTYYGIPNE